jgi:hypothetical protein
MSNTYISLSELSAAGIRLGAAEAATITREIVDRVLRGLAPGIPSADVIRITPEGAITIDGPIAADSSVGRAARLLDSLLPELGSPTDVRVPGALRLVVARALGMLDLPPHASLQQFSSALERFAAPDAAAALASLYERWSSAAAGRVHVRQSPAELTISDVRRARRATGLTLRDISTRSRIPVSLLRELEWGYFVNWPAGHYGRTQLVRYARAAGLDDQVVVGAVWPVLQDAVRAREAAAPVADGPSPTRSVVETRLVRIGPTALVARARAPRRRRAVLAALAIPALLGVAALPMVFMSDEPSVMRPPAEAPQPVAAQKRPAVEPDAPAPADVQPAAKTRARGTTQLAAAPQRDEPRARPASLRADEAFSPAFATTGSAMFFHADEGDRSALMRADTDANGAVLKVTSIVDDSARNFHARPSPDGRMIAFDSDREGERAVYIADADGRAVRRVSGEGFAAVPSWSPDGRRLTFVRAEPDRPRVWNLWMVDLATGETTRVTSHRVGQPWGAAWFPDGERIAYSHEDRLIVRTIDGRNEQIYPSPRAGRLVRTPAVSPDGRKVVFQLYRDGAWMLDLRDGSMRRILSDPTAEEFTWAPDGRRVAYHSRKTGEWNVWLMAPR